MDSLTPEERRALDDYIHLTREERDTFFALLKFLNHASKSDDDVKNLYHLVDIVRKRPQLISIIRRAELWDEGRRYVIMAAGLASAITTILVLYKTVLGGL